MTLSRIVLLAAIAFLSACAHTPNASDAPKADEKLGVDHVLVMVFDQMRPDYIDRFQLKNFQRLRDQSRNFTDAYVGYMGSETVVSHLVIPTGLLPKQLPWQDDVWMDDQGILGEAGAFYSTGDLSFAQMDQLMRTLPNDQFLAARIKAKFGGKVYTAGEKMYAAYIFGTPESDSIITLKKANGVCTPVGRNVPEWISSKSRFTVDCSKKYGTEKAFYSLDGSRFVPGDDPAHLGGDVWTGDVAHEIFEKNDWSGMFLTFGGVDKVAHMLGEADGKRPVETEGVQADYTLESVLKVADLQLGRVLDELDARGLTNRTLVVLTADHGGQTNTHYLGNGKTAKWGHLKNEEAKDAPESVKKYAKDENVKFTFQDSAIRVWLKDPLKPEPTIKEMQQVPGIAEIFKLQKKGKEWIYVKAYSNLKKKPMRFQKWMKAYAHSIVSGMATSNAPNLVGLLDDGYGFDLPGDHGGAQENVQRVPLLIRMPGEKPRRSKEPLRLDQVKKEITRRLKLDPTE